MPRACWTQLINKVEVGTEPMGEDVRWPSSELRVLQEVQQKMQQQGMWFCNLYEHQQRPRAEKTCH